jgi:hypothetical protein
MIPKSIRIGVLVVAPLPLVLLDELDHPVLPLGRVAHLGVGRVPRRLVGDLVEHVGQVVDSVDDLPDVGLLERLDPRVERAAENSSTSRRISTARWVPGRCWSAAMKASSTLSRRR